MRNDSLELKTRNLIQQSISHAMAFQVMGYPYIGEVSALLDHFRNDRVYVVGLPNFITYHPELTTVMVNPEWDHLPTDKVLSVRPTICRDFFHMAEVIREKLDDGKEVYIYSVYPHPTYQEGEVNTRPVLRSVSLPMGYWYDDSMEYVVPFKSNDILIKKDIKRLKF